MLEMRTTINPTVSGFIAHHPRLGLAQLLFLVSALFAPMHLTLVGSFTVYDLLITVVATLLMLTGPRGLRFPPTELNTAICIFLLFAFLSAFRAPYPLEALTQTLQFAFIFFIQLPVILTVVRSPSMSRLSLILFVGGQLIDIGLAMSSPQGPHRAASVFGDSANRLGYPTAYSLPFVLYLLIDHWRRKRSWVVWAALASPVFYLLIWALTASASRGATLATMVAVTVFLTFRRRFEINATTLLRILSVIVVIGLLIYLLFGSDYFPANLRRRFELFGQGEVQDERMLLNIVGWRAFLDSPLIGIGLDNFRYVITQYGVFLPVDHVPHNLWIQFLAHIGLIGTLAFLMLMILWFLWLFRAQRVSSTQAQREFVWAFIASMAAIMTGAMLMTGILDRKYWLIYGLGLATVFSAREIQASRRLGRTSERNAEDM